MRGEGSCTHSVNIHYTSFTQLLGKSWSHARDEAHGFLGLQVGKQTSGTRGDEGMHTQARTGQPRAWQAFLRGLGWRSCRSALGARPQSERSL